MNCLLHRWWLRRRLRRLDAAIGRAVAQAGAHGDGLQLHEMQRVVEALCMARAVARVRLDTFVQQRQAPRIEAQRYAGSR